MRGPAARARGNKVRTRGCHTPGSRDGSRDGRARKGTGGHGTESRDLQRRAGSGVGEGSLWDGLRALGGQKFFRPILDANFIS